MPLSDYIPYAALSLALINFVYLLIKGYISDTSGIDKRMDSLEARVVSLETKIDPFWNVICRNLPNLISSNPPSKELIKKLCDFTASPEELYELRDETERALRLTNGNDARLLLLMGVIESEILKAKRERKKL